MDAEDTKERIRQLRMRVGSDPASIVPGQDFSPLTEERLKAVKNWKTVSASNEKLNVLPSGTITEKIPPEKLLDIEREFENRYQENLDSNDQKGLVRSGSKNYNLELLEEIDERIKNNAKEFIKYFDERVQKMRKDIVSNESFNEYKQQLQETLSQDNAVLTEILESKLTNLEATVFEQNSELAEYFSNQLVDITKTARVDLDKAFKQSSLLQTILPDKVAEVENKIFSEFNDKVHNLRTEISNLKDTFIMRSEVIDSELRSEIENLGDELTLHKEKNEEEKRVTKTTLDEKLTSTMATLQTDMVESLSQVEAEVDALRSSVAADSKEAKSEFNARVENVDHKVGSIVNTVQTELHEKFQNLESEIGSLKDTFALRSEAIKSNLDEKFRILEKDVGDIRDSSSLRSEALSSELGFQIDDLKQMIDLTAQNAQREDESIRSYFDEQVEVITAVTQATAMEKHDQLKTEVGNMRHLFTLRSDAIASELGLRVDDLKAIVDSNNGNNTKEIAGLRSSLEERMTSNEEAVQNSLDQQLKAMKTEIVEFQNSLQTHVEKGQSKLKILIFLLLNFALFH